MIQFVTTATGEAHRARAERLDASFVEWGWPELLVVSDAPLAARENILARDDIGRGRGLKTRFGEFADTSGTVVYIDADCLATGPFRGVPSPGWNTLSGIVTARLEDLPPGLDEIMMARGMMDHLASCCLVADAATARRASRLWHADLKERVWTGSDEIALNACLAGKIRRRDLGGTFSAPLPNLVHLATGGGKMPG